MMMIMDQRNIIVRISLHINFMLVLVLPRSFFIQKRRQTDVSGGLFALIIKLILVLMLQLEWMDEKKGFRTHVHDLRPPFYLLKLKITLTNFNNNNINENNNHTILSILSFSIISFNFTCISSSDSMLTLS